MTDPTTGTGRPGDAVDPDARFGPETAGPDATPEQEAFVAGLLGSLRADDPEVPDHVAARIDGVLAELRRSETVLPAVPGGGSELGGAAALSASDDADADVAGQTSSAVHDATVLPMPTARRESGTSRTFRWVAGAAAAVVVLGGGAAVVRSVLPGDSSSSSLASGDSTSGGGPVPIRSSGTDYSSTALASQAQSLVASASKGVELAPEVATGGTPDVAPTGSGVAAPNARLLAPDTLTACLEQLTGAPGAKPVAIDQGTYEGKPADVVVLPSPDDARRLEVWVIGPGCTRENVSLYEFRTIPVVGESPAPEASQSDAPAPPTGDGTVSTP